MAAAHVQNPVPAGNPTEAVRRVAVIDIGTTAVRMTIAELSGPRIRPLEFLQQAVTLGKDTFTRGAIGPDSLNACVQALRSFRRIMEEHAVTRPDQIRAVATTAVREAANRDLFLDRLYVATGIEVEPLHPAAVTRLTYLSVHPFLQAHPDLFERRVLVAEVGGGSTELLLLQRGNVLLSESYSLGSLRMRKMGGAFDAPLHRYGNILHRDIDRFIAQIRPHFKRRPQHLLALGGDARFAAQRLRPKAPLHRAELPLRPLQTLCEKVLSMSVDESASRFRLPFPDAETLGPALLAYSRMARAFRLPNVLVTGVTMRDGLLRELAGEGELTEEFRERISASVLELAGRYACDENHIRHVNRLAGAIFDALRNAYDLGTRHQMLLTAAALLHDVGTFVSARSHHKHSQYVIQNSEVFGLGDRDLMLVALIARYHRRSAPKPTHTEYQNLDREGRLTVQKLAAILRVADALDRSHTQRIDCIRCEHKGERFVIGVSHPGDLSLETVALREKGAMFEDVYGKTIELRRIP